MRSTLCTVTVVCLATATSAGDGTEFIRQAQSALKKGDAAAALEAANKAVEADPKSPDAVFTRGEVYAAQRKHAEAIKDYDAALALDKTFVVAIDRRGGERFKLGQIDESLADFNAYLKAVPKAEPAHWRRGISFYYAGKYAEGAKQFFDGQGDFGADVENVFWHFLCNARKDGIDKALAKDRLDAIVAPTGGPAWLIDLVNGDSVSGVSSSQPPAVAGYPAVTVPAGFISGLPIGMTLMGPAWSEGVLLKYAYAFEQATKHRRAPTLARTVSLAESFE